MITLNGTDIVNDVLDAIASSVQRGGGTAKLALYGGSGLVVEFNLPNPAFTRTGTRLILNGTPITGTAVSTQVPTQFYVFDRAGNGVLYSGSVANSGDVDMASPPAAYGCTNGNTQTLTSFSVYIVAGTVKTFGSLTLT